MNSVEYVGKDLEAMHFAVAYHRWILRLISPYLGKKIVEVGAGSGSFSEMLWDLDPQLLALVEPSAMFDELHAKFAINGRASRVRLFHDVFANVSDEIHRVGPPDSILYVNVLEHINDDQAELTVAHDTLQKRGRIVIFVPAMPLLFSEFDKSIGHFRRYRRRELRHKVESAGFRILNLRWFDMLGILPWFVKYRLMQSLKMEASSVRAYDRLAVPLVRPLESLVHPPIGKNLLLIAERR